MISIKNSVNGSKKSVEIFPSKGKKLFPIFKPEKKTFSYDAAPHELRQNCNLHKIK